MTLLFVLVVAGAAIGYHASTPEQRTRFVNEVVHPVAVRMDQVIFAAQPFRETLRTRTPRLVVTPVLAGLNLLAFLAMLVGDGALGAPATLVDWGANYGPRTTNGEWWRLLTASFVQGGPFHLLFLLVGLLQVSELLERMVGPVIVACVYVTAALAASLVALWDYPLAVHAGASSAVCGLYGLLIAVTVWGVLRPTGLTIPVPAFQLLLPASALFLLYSLATHGLASRPDATGFIIGLVGGLALTRTTGERKPSLRPLAIGMVGAAVWVAFSAWSLRGIVDVRAELVDLVASEDRAAMVYRGAIARYTLKRVPVDRRATIELIDGTLLPQLLAKRARITQFAPLAEHQAFVRQAVEYLRLREESWRLCVEGWRKSNADTLREAESLQRSASEVLQKLRGIDAAIAVYV